MDESKKQTLMTTLKQIEKQFGKGAVMRLGDVGAVLDVETVSTGSLGLDIALGIGGLPLGRVVEIYGPEASGKTTLTLHAVAEIQKNGGIAAFIDAEHALDSQYAAKLGVNVSELLLSQPSNGEEALEIADIFVRSGTVDLVVIDSVAALVPKAEIEGEMGDAHMGLQARLMSQALRKLTANIKRSNTLVIFINQIRMKIGVTWGCFHYESPVLLADGSTEKIGHLVQTKQAAEVLAYNQEAQSFEAKRIVNWFDNGDTETFLHFKVAAHEGNAHRFACTANHQLLTPNGYRAAGELTVGDKLITAENFYYSPILEQILWGNLLAGERTQVYTEEYRLWKQTLLSYRNTIEQEQFSVHAASVGCETAVLEQPEKAISRILNDQLLDRLQPLAIAIWYMDSGIFETQPYRCVLNCGNLSKSKQLNLVRWFYQWGITPSLNLKGRIDFNGAETLKFHQLIAPYVHPAMDYKLLAGQRGRFIPLEIEHQQARRATAMPIMAIERLPAKHSRRFDLEIEDQHNYIVDGVVVHNSPETTTGGNALKFYASVRLDIRRTGALKRSDEIIGNETRVKIVKNKLAPPLREVSFDIIYGEGISRLSELIDLGTKHDIIEKSGTWYSYHGERLGQGKENVRQYLLEHKEVAETIEKLLRDRLLAKPLASNSKAADDNPKAAAEDNKKS